MGRLRRFITHTALSARGGPASGGHPSFKKSGGVFGQQRYKFMIIDKSAKTNWFHVMIVVGVTVTSIYFISNALAKTYIQLEEVNETKIEEINSLIEE